MAYALMTSGGKNATVALDRARRQGMDVRWCATVIDDASERIPFHGTRWELAARQADVLGLEPVTARMSPVEPFEVAFVNLLRALKRQGASGTIFGHVHLEDVRAWYEERVHATGLEHVEPLWGEPGVEVAWEVIERGYRAVIASVMVNHAAVRFLGRELDADTLTEISCIDSLDACGERGEYHTFVFDGPEFHDPIEFTRGRVSDAEDHRTIDLVPLRIRRAAKKPGS
jgi:uncharacterized protein (TIGR00290 family)